MLKYTQSKDDSPLLYFLLKHTFCTIIHYLTGEALVHSCHDKWASSIRVQRFWVWFGACSLSTIMHSLSLWWRRVLCITFWAFLNWARLRCCEEVLYSNPCYDCFFIFWHSQWWTVITTSGPFCSSTAWITKLNKIILKRVLAQDSATVTKYTFSTWKHSFLFIVWLDVRQQPLTTACVWPHLWICDEKTF